MEEYVLRPLSPNPRCRICKHELSRGWISGAAHGKKDVCIGCWDGRAQRYNSTSRYGDRNSTIQVCMDLIWRIKTESKTPWGYLKAYHD